MAGVKSSLYPGITEFGNLIWRYVEAHNPHVCGSRPHVRELFAFHAGGESVRRHFTHLAHKAEHAADLQTGAVVAFTTASGRRRRYHDD